MLTALGILGDQREFLSVCGFFLHCYCKSFFDNSLDSNCFISDKCASFSDNHCFEEVETKQQHETLRISH